PNRPSSRPRPAPKRPPPRLASPVRSLTPAARPGIYALAQTRRSPFTRIARDGDDRTAHGPRPRHAVHHHHPHPRYRRHSEGELRPSRNANGDGPRRVLPLAALPALRPGGPDLAQPRPVRALGRTRVDAAVCPPPPGQRAGGGPRLRDARPA